MSGICSKHQPDPFGECFECKCDILRAEVERLRGFLIEMLGFYDQPNAEYDVKRAAKEAYLLNRCENLLKGIK